MTELITSEKAIIAAWARNQRLQELREYSEATHGKWVVADGVVKNTLTGEIAYEIGEFAGEKIYYFVDKVVISPEELRSRPGGAKSITFSEVVVYSYPEWVKDAKAIDCHVGNIYDKREWLSGETTMPLNTIAYIPVFREVSELVKGGRIVSDEKPTTYWTSGVKPIAENDKIAEAQYD